MKELSDTGIALAKHPKISYVTISELSAWVTDEDRTIARKAEQERDKQWVKSLEDLAWVFNPGKERPEFLGVIEDLKKQAEGKGLIV